MPAPLPGGPQRFLLRGAAAVTPSAVLTDAAVAVDSGRIAAVGPATFDLDTLFAGWPTRDLGGGVLLAGFVDQHCHGGGGASFAATDRAEVEAAAQFHLAHGSTTMLASLVTAPVADLCAQLATVAEVVASGTSPVIGSHLEGPFLAPSRCGAHNPDHLLAPDPSVFQRLLDASRGTLRMITLAPELPGAHEVIAAARRADVIVAVGHTDATYAQTRAAIEAGATVATHLFNGMRPLHHREPGPALAALDTGIGCELILDGVHVHPALLGLVTARSPDQLILVTDAIAAAGCGDGRYELGGLAVTVAEGRARVAVDGPLAGSTLTLDDALRRAVRQAGLDLSIASAATSANPARALGILPDRGQVAVGARADLVHVDDTLALRGVLWGGVWVVEPSAPPRTRG